MLLDTNVLLSWLVGVTDRSLFRSFKRVQAFELEDFLLLRTVLSGTTGLITTPHVLAEAINFVDQAPLYRRPALVRSFVDFIGMASEFHQPATLLSSRADFSQLGLTDASIHALSAETTVITSEFRLWGMIVGAGGNCVNFSHLRSSRF